MILALDLSTPRGALAVVSEDGEVVFSEHFRAHRSHNALVFDPLERAMAKCGDHGPSWVAIGTGPGSYTGVRVAIAAGIGVSMARGIPIVGLPSAFAANSEAGDRPVPADGRFLLVGDARRGKFFGAHMGGNSERPEFEAVVYGPGELQEWVSARADLDVFTFDPEPPEPAPMAIRAFPDAVRLGAVIAEMGEAERTDLAGQSLEPVYLSAPFVTTPKA